MDISKKTWKIIKKVEKNLAVCVRTRTVNVDMFSSTSIICLEIEMTVKDEISEGW